MTPPTRLYLLRAATGVACVAALAACWVIFYRLASGSFYAFALIGDEGSYAVHLQPLLAGCTKTNQFNGLCDPRYISQWFLEDFIRTAISLSGLDTISFVWLWRFVYPCLLLGAVVLLARACLPRARAGWSWELRGAAAALAFTLLYLLYDLLVSYPPLQGWLHRFPTNIEFILSVLLAERFISFLAAPMPVNGITLALASAALVYLRPYTAIPWSLTIVIGLLWLIATRQVAFKVAFITLGALLLALAPWTAVLLWDRALPVYAQVLARNSHHRLYEINPRWQLYLGLGAAFATLAIWLPRPQRVLLWASGLSMFMLPFISSLFIFAVQLHDYERFAAFFLVILVSAGLLALGRYSLAWRGSKDLAASGVLLASAFLAAGILGWRNANYDLQNYPEGPYQSMHEELKYLPAYDWIREHTAPSALFLFDDGCDWSTGRLPEDAHTLSNLLVQGDLFQLVARRRRVLAERIISAAFSDDDLEALRILQCGTFGFPVGNNYLPALKRFPPNYIFIRKETPLTRGMLPKFKTSSEKVYADPVCEVWKINYSTHE